MKSVIKYTINKFEWEKIEQNYCFSLLSLEEIEPLEKCKIDSFILFQMIYLTLRDNQKIFLKRFLIFNKETAERSLIAELNLTIFILVLKSLF